MGDEQSEDPCLNPSNRQFGWESSVKKERGRFRAVALEKEDRHFGRQQVAETRLLRDHRRFGQKAIGHVGWQLFGEAVPGSDHEKIRLEGFQIWIY